MNRRRLPSAVRLASKIADPRASIPVLSGVRLTGDGATLTVRAVDLERWITATLPSTFVGDVIVDLGGLIAALRSRPDVELTQVAEPLALVVSGATLPSQPLADWPRWPDAVTGPAFTLPAAELGAALAATMPAASRDPVRPHMQCVAWQGTHDRTCLVATDGHRLHTRAMHHAMPGGDALIPLPACKTIAALCALSPDPVQIARRDGTLIVSASDGDLSISLQARLADATFPPWQQVVPTETPPVQIACDTAPLREALAAAVAIVRAADRTAYPYVCLSELDGALLVTRDGYRTTVPATVRPGVVVGVDARLLIDALAARGTERVALAQDDRPKAAKCALNPFLVLDGDGQDGGNIVVVMPARVTAPAPAAPCAPAESQAAAAPTAPCGRRRHRPRRSDRR